MMQPSSKAYPHLYPVQIWSKLDWWFLRYRHFCILPLFFLFSPLSDHPAPETWSQNQLHNNWSPSLHRPQQMPLLVCWQLGWHPSTCPSMLGTPKMPILLLHILPYPAELVLLNCILPDSEDHLRYIYAALGTKSLEMHAQWMPTGGKKEQKATKAKASAFLD